MQTEKSKQQEGTPRLIHLRLACLALRSHPGDMEMGETGSDRAGYIMAAARSHSIPGHDAGIGL